jgi:hypothetical protein
VFGGARVQTCENVLIHGYRRGIVQIKGCKLMPIGNENILHNARCASEPKNVDQSVCSLSVREMDREKYICFQQ